MKCYCGSKKNYKDCCQRFLEEKAYPNTAEELMRSRYSAYSKCDFHYIEKTAKEKAKENFNIKDTEKVLKNINWTNLYILKTYKENENLAFVEFIAEYNESGEIKELHEISKFRRIDNRWFYVDGKIL